MWRITSNHSRSLASSLCLRIPHQNRILPSATTPLKQSNLRQLTPSFTQLASFANHPGAPANQQSNPVDAVGDRLVKESLDAHKWDSDSTDFRNAVSRALAIVCERGGFSYGEAWYPSANGVFECSQGWNAERHLLNTMTLFRQELEGKTAPPDSTLADVVKNQKPILNEIITEADARLYGNAFFEKLGFKSNLALPIVQDGKVYAIVTFFSSAQKKLTKEQLDNFTHLNNSIIGASLTKSATRPDRSQDLITTVYNTIVSEGVFNTATVYNEVDWFFNNLDLQQYYFEHYPASVVAKHVHSYIAAKKLAQATGNPENISLSLESSKNNSAFYLCPSDSESISQVEIQIEKLIDQIPQEKAFTMTHFLSKGTAIPGGTKRLGLYILDSHEYIQPKVDPAETDIWKVASGVFLHDKTKLIRDRYQDVLKKASLKLSPVLEVFPVYRDGTTPVMFGFKRSSGKSTSYLSGITEIIEYTQLDCQRKFIETFSNGLVVYSFYFNPCDRAKINHFLDLISLLYLIPPKSDLRTAFLAGQIDGYEYAYFSTVSRCVYYFLDSKPNEELLSLSSAFKDNPALLSRLHEIHKKLRVDAVSLPRITDCVKRYPVLSKAIFDEFNNVCTGKTPGGNPELPRQIKKTVENELDEQIMTSFHTFNTSLLKTNFHRQRKSSLSFRLDPKFLGHLGYKDIPYGIFFVAGSDFTGFHIRFRDVARGGIRVIRSGDGSNQIYNRNLETLFNENYNLAKTQQKKNKDLPEFGSKGTILLGQESQTNSFLAFQKYVSGLLDLLIKDDRIIDHFGKEEILFLGPDEGTADFMYWAAIYARKRGYAFWKAFTTGKPPSLGGVPHDTYGMTTRSVHRYVTGCLEKKGLKEENVTKLQTGGPDGDLGSNEILISKDKTIAVVDGSGVLYDPQGIDRASLIGLANQRKMINNFDTSKLSAKGFRVLVADRDVTLPDGTTVESGLQFRNEFHLLPYSSADLFVPCGGRPESVNLSNVHRLFHADGTPRFKIIVEGANLFFTDDARAALEKAGVVVYKDASANKGGVLSSSLEVLAALSLNDEEFHSHMQVKDGAEPPQFYKEYVEEIQKRVESNAALEFECIWREHESTKTPRYLLTDQVSDKINSLNDAVQKSTLWDNLALRKTVLEQAIPRRLLDFVGLEKILERVPENYVKAIFCAYLSSRFVYKFGLTASDLAFFEFMQPFLLGDVEALRKL